MEIDSSPYNTPVRHHHLTDSANSIRIFNINDINTPTRRIISASRTSSEVNSDSVYHTPTKTTPDHYSYLQSPLKAQSRSQRNQKRKILRRDNHLRRLRNQPSKLDLLEPGFTSFPLDPPELDTSPSPRHVSQKSMFIVEDYIEDNNVCKYHHTLRKISVMDFKKNLQEQVGTFAAFTRAKSELDQSNNSISQLAVKLLFPTATEENAVHLNIDNANAKRCVVCEVELSALPTDSCFQELVCFDCTEQYEQLVTLINSDPQAYDDEDDLEDYQNLTTVVIGEHNARKRSLEENDTFDKIYKSFKRIQDENNRKLIETQKFHFHNPLLKVQSKKLNFNFNMVSDTNDNTGDLFWQRMKKSIDKFRELNLKNDSNSEDFWIKARKLINWYTLNNDTATETETIQTDDESFVRWE